MKICIVEDSKSLLFSLKKLMAEQKYVVRGFELPSEALKVIPSEEFDLFMLDVNLPETNGYELAQKIRKYNQHSPIMFLTVRDSIDDKILGFEAGADDYITKPFEPAELIARVKALLRRKVMDQSEALEFSGLKLNVEDKQVYFGEIEIPLTLTEFQILEYLMRNIGKVVDKDRVASMIWEDPFEMSPNLVSVYVSKLRKKLESYTKGIEIIKTIKGFGYRIG
jgi:DNA-binding response OmpR family regulator